MKRVFFCQVSDGYLLWFHLPVSETEKVREFGAKDTIISRQWLSQ